MSKASFVISNTSTGSPLLAVINGDNSEQNNLFKSIANSFNAATPGSYKQILESITRNNEKTNLNALISKEDIAKATDFYINKNVTAPWNPTKQGLNPPTGAFDAAYYASQNPDLLNQWSNAEKGVAFGSLTLPDVDITKRYNQETFLHQHYSTTGKASGLRGNAAEATSLANTYEETRQELTDAERQLFRDTFLGVGSETGEAPIDATIEQIVNQQNQKNFNFLVQDVLKTTVQKVNKAREQEGLYDFYAGIPGFDEVVNFKSTLSNSLLGDSGVGGYLTMAGQGKTVKKLEKGIESLLGTKDSVSYNWQKWFDESLANKYENLTEIVDPKDAKTIYKMDKEFAKTFVKDYLKPRFDNSKSMSEFISYIDVKDNEQSILQTQTITNKLKQLGMQKADSFLSQLSTQNKGYFDPDFYFEPTGNTEKEQLYAKQKTNIVDAWNQAKTKSGELVNGMTWNQWAYKYGMDVNDKKQFAKLHYEVLGKQSGFDASSDSLTNTDVFNYINNELTPYLSTAKESFGDNVFLQFMTPEQFTDQLISKLDPLKTPGAWNATLKEYGIDATNKSIEDVRELILDAARTNPAKNIRSSIKQLNEKRKTPTQKNLGIGYIQREVDDVTKTASKETTLYKIFKNSGYGGTENDFYQDFMPDIDRHDQQTISDVLKKGTSKIKFSVDTSDPFAAINSIESLFSNTENQSMKDTQRDSYFTLFGDAEKKAEEKDSSLFNILNF